MEIWLLLARVEVRPHFFSVLFVCSGRVQLLSVSFLGYFFPSCWSRRNRRLLGIFSDPIDVSSLPTTPASRLGYVRNKEDSENPPPFHSLDPEVPSGSAFFSPFFSVYI